MSARKKQAKPAPKRSPVPSAPSADPAEDLITAAMAPLARSVKALNDYTDRLATKLAQSDFDRDLGSHYAWVTRLIAQILGEIRKLAEAKRREADKMTLEQVMAWLRQQTADRRAHVLREMQQIDSGASVLA